MRDRPSESWWERKRFGYLDLAAIIAFTAAIHWLVDLYR